MVYKKTCWYTFIAPMQIGGVITDLDERRMAMLRRYASYVGEAFQIQDDVLNLVANEKRYGKEIGGDLWEGKHTLILLHMMRSAGPAERRKAERCLGKPRELKTEADIAPLLELIHRYGSIDYARDVAQMLAHKADQLLERTIEWMPPSVHREFIHSMAQHVIQRDR